MIVGNNQQSSFKTVNKSTICNDGIIGLSKSYNSIFGINCQVSDIIIADKCDKQLKTENLADETGSVISTNHSESTEHTETSDFTDSIDSVETTDTADATDSSSDKYVNSYHIFSRKPKKYIRPKNNHKKIASSDRESFHYTGGIVSEFNKDSPFINMLVNRRIRVCENGPSCHIAAFVKDLGMENKFTGWAFGKLAIGENSERMRFGDDRLSTHAEMDALKKLDGLIRVQKCKKQKMDLVVIRVNKSGNLCESAPCYHCTKELEQTKVVSINKLYFSRSDGTITCVKFSKWLKNEHFHVSKGWRRMNCVYK